MCWLKWASTGEGNPLGHPGLFLPVARALPFVLSLKYSGHSLVSYLESGCSFLSPGPSRPFSSSVQNHSDLQFRFIHRQDIFSPLPTLSFNLAFLLGVTSHGFLVLSLDDRFLLLSLSQHLF